MNSSTKILSVIVGVSLIIILSMTLSEAYAQTYSEQYKKGYDDGYYGKSPINIDSDYQRGYHHGDDDRRNKNHHNFLLDSDPDKKGGGGDPIVLGKWGYVELGNDKECNNSPSPFDYDNDSFREHMCYWYHPETKILFVDFNGNQKLDNGYELLNAKGYANALDILRLSPEICTVSDCYIWKDTNSNI